MKKTNFIIFSILIFAGCATTMGTRYVNEVGYSLALVHVDRPKETRDRWGGMEKIELSEKDKYQYEDKLINSYFFVSSDRISFDFENKTENSIKIIWNEACFIDLDGNSSRVMHAGIKYADRNSSQPPSIVPGNGNFSDVILPSDRVMYNEGYYSTYYSKPGSWKHLGLVQPQIEIVKKETGQIDQVAISDSLKLRASNVVRKRIGVLLPLEIQGIVNEYTFWFEVKSYNILNPVPVSVHHLFR